MAIKSFFMNEMYDIRQKISSLQLKLQQEKLNPSGNNNVCEKDKNIIIEDLKTKLGFIKAKISNYKTRRWQNNQRQRSFSIKIMNS